MPKLETKMVLKTHENISQEVARKCNFRSPQNHFAKVCFKNLIKLEKVSQYQRVNDNETDPQFELNTSNAEIFKEM